MENMIFLKFEWVHSVSKKKKYDGWLGNIMVPNKNAQGQHYPVQELCQKTCGNMGNIMFMYHQQYSSYLGMMVRWQNKSFVQGDAIQYDVISTIFIQSF